MPTFRTLIAYQRHTCYVSRLFAQHATPKTNQFGHQCVGNGMVHIYTHYLSIRPSHLSNLNTLQGKTICSLKMIQFVTTSNVVGVHNIPIQTYEQKVDEHPHKNSGELKCISMPHDDQIFYNHWHHSLEQRHYSLLTCSKSYIHIIQVDYCHRFQWIEVEAWYHNQIIGNMVKMTQENMLTKPITHN
jgi:hypothetical protein